MSSCLQTQPLLFLDCSLLSAATALKGTSNFCAIFTRICVRSPGRGAGAVGAGVRHSVADHGGGPASCQ